MGEGVADPLSDRDLRDEGWSRVGCLLQIVRQIGCMLFLPALAGGSLMFVIAVCFLVTRCM